MKSRLINVSCDGVNYIVSLTRLGKIWFTIKALARIIKSTRIRVLVTIGENNEVQD